MKHIKYLFTASILFLFIYHPVFNYDYVQWDDVTYVQNNDYKKQNYKKKQ